MEKFPYLCSAINKIKNHGNSNIKLRCSQYAGTKGTGFHLIFGFIPKKRKKSSFERALEDIEQGNVFYINGPKK